MSPPATESGGDAHGTIWGIRRSIRGAVLVVSGGGAGYIYDHLIAGSNTGWGVVAGVVIGSTAAMYLDRREKHGSVAGRITGVIVLVWIVAVKIITQT